MEEAIQFLFNLQSYDMRLVELIQNLANVPQNIVDFDERIEQLKQNIVQEKTQIQDRKLEIQKLEKEVKSSEEGIISIKHKLAFTKNLQDYNNLAQKIAGEESKITHTEEILLAKMFEVDSLETEFADRQQIVALEIQKLRNEQDHQRQRTVDLEENINKVQNKIAVMRQILQENHTHWLQCYDNTKKAIRRMPCIVELRNVNFCGGCHLKLSDYQDKTVDPHFPFMICDSCARMILLSPEMDFDETENDSDGVEISCSPDPSRFPKRREK
jgi:predicted  nucleic acid-binding Zn-ribbon protein